MTKFRLCGLAEGIVGKSFVEAESFEDIFEKYPALAAVKGKLECAGTVMCGYTPCDG